MGVEEQTWRILAEVKGIAAYQDLEKQIKANDAILLKYQADLKAATMSEDDFTKETKKTLEQQKELEKQLKFTKAQFDSLGSIKPPSFSGEVFTKYKQNITSASYALQDFASTQGNLAQRINSVSNNVTGLTAGLGGIGLALNGIIPVVSLLINNWDFLKETFTGTASEFSKTVDGMKKKLGELEKVKIKSGAELLQIDSLKTQIKTSESALDAFKEMVVRSSKESKIAFQDFGETLDEVFDNAGNRMEGSDIAAKIKSSFLEEAKQLDGAYQKYVEKKKFDKEDITAKLKAAEETAADPTSSGVAKAAAERSIVDYKNTLNEMAKEVMDFGPRHALKAQEAAGKIFDRLRSGSAQERANAEADLAKRAADMGMTGFGEAVKGIGPNSQVQAEFDRAKKQMKDSQDIQVLNLKQTQEATNNGDKKLAKERYDAAQKEVENSKKAADDAEAVYNQKKAGLTDKARRERELDLAALKDMAREAKERMDMPAYKSPLLDAFEQRAKSPEVAEEGRKVLEAAREANNKLSEQLTEQGQKIEEEMFKDLGKKIQDSLGKGFKAGLEEKIIKSLGTGVSGKQQFDQLVQQFSSEITKSFPEMAKFPDRLVNIAKDMAHATLESVDKMVKDLEALEGLTKQQAVFRLQQKGAEQLQGKEERLALDEFTKVALAENRKQRQFFPGAPFITPEAAREQGQAMMAKLKGLGLHQVEALQIGQFMSHPLTSGRVPGALDLLMDPKRGLGLGEAEAFRALPEFFNQLGIGPDARRMKGGTAAGAIARMRQAMEKQEEQAARLREQEARKAPVRFDRVPPLAMEKWVREEGRAKALKREQDEARAKRFVGPPVPPPLLPRDLRGLRGREAPGPAPIIPAKDAAAAQQRNKIQEDRIEKARQQDEARKRAAENRQREMMGLPPLAALGGAQINNQQKLIGATGGLTNVVAQQKGMIQRQAAQINQIALAVRQLSTQRQNPTALMMGRA